MQNTDKMIQELQDNWNLPWVLRIQSRQASGGVFNSHTMKMAEQRGDGPANRFKIGHKIAWPKEDFFQWLKEKIKE